MKYAFQMGSGIMIYIYVYIYTHTHTHQFHKDCFRDSKVNRGDIYTRRQKGDRISLL
jgi:hypothetical protein